ncbi:LysE/ArgO family amino acid transporter [Nocardia wallacei]|uniref:LysE/ArgO family amino acid transporter n=1 Tax=Nocardia wallacei TaxID=480035 RepID=UPI001656CA9F|nr:LysE family transporter [Nocardia wallacei]
MSVSAVLPGLGFGLSLIVAIGAQNAFVLRQGIGGAHIRAVIAVCTLSDVVLIAAGIGGAGAVLTTAPVLLDVARHLGGAFLLAYAALAVRRALSPGSLRTGPDPHARTSRGNPGPPHSRTGIREPAQRHTAGALPPATASRAIGTVTTGNTIVDATTAPAGARAADTPALPAAVAPTRPRTTAARSPLVRTILTCLALTWLNPHVYLDTVVLMGSFGNTYGPDRWSFAAGAMLASVLWFAALGYGSRLLAPVFARPTAWRVLDSAIALIMLALGLSLLLR